MRLSIQQMQFTAAAVIATSCLLLASLITFPSISNYLKYKSGSEELGRYSAALTAVWAISAERGPSNDIMGRAGSLEDLTPALLAARQRTDEQLQQLQATFPSEFQYQLSLTHALDEVKSKLSHARQIVDQVARLPASQRKGQQLSTAIHAMFDVAESGTRLRDTIGKIVVDNAPVIGLDIIMVGAAGTMRDRIGRLGSYVVISLESDEMTKTAYRATFEIELQRVTSLKNLLKTYADSYLQSKPVEQALADVEKSYFNETLRYAQDTINSSASARPVGVEEFSKKYVAGIKSTSVLRDLLVQTVREKTLAEKRHALVAGAISSLLALVAISVMSILAIIYRQTVFLPMLAARQQIVSIANGDLSEAPPAANMAREMVKMFHGLNFLREQLRRKQALEQEREEMADQLWKLSRTDPLTGIFNRRALEEIASYIIDDLTVSTAGLGVMIIDIDHFKSINDRHGHAAGDMVLQRTAKVLTKNLRSTDILARYGGEEFVIILQDVDHGTTLASAERLRKAIENSAANDLDGIPITASFGVAWRDTYSGATWEEIMITADEMLYQAKREGRNRVAAVEFDRAS